MKRHLAIRAACAVAMVLGLVITSAGQDSIKNPRAKEIADLEEQIAQLQSKLKALKETPEFTTEVNFVSKGDLPAGAAKLFAWRPIGPANMGGRITSLAVFEADPSTYYAATASGGLLKTVNNGSTFEHQFDKEATVSLGAVAVAATDRNLVWVGTGEGNPRNSVSWGDGVYKSTDGGKTWKNMGLKQSFQIGKIIVHPKDPNIVYVAALGRLYGPSEERGLYKTTDGGKNWQRVLHIDDRTGVLELIMNPKDPEMLIAATWERQRDEFDSFRGDAKQPPAVDVYAPAKTHAPGTGLHKTTDGGKTWKKLDKGLPKALMGRIGLDWHRNNPNQVFAIIDTDKAGTGLPPTQAFLGVTTEASPKGLRAASVVAGGPASNGGLQNGDILLKLDGRDLKGPTPLTQQLQPRKPGDKVKLLIRRDVDGKAAEKEIEVTLGTRPPQGNDPAQQRGSLGVNFEESEDGALLTEIIPEGAAQKAGLKEGDIIQKIDGVVLDNPRLQLFKLLAGKKPGDKVTITYQRGKEKKDLEMKLELAPQGTPGRPYGGRLAGQAANVQDQQGPDGDNTGGIYKSTDAGETWTRINSLNERPFYFSVVRVDPSNDKHIYALGVSLWRSTDGGKTFSSQNINKGVHADHHDLWINPKDGRHVITGTDGGIYVTYDRAVNWEHLNHMALGQFYHIAVDNRRPYRVYGGLQDNGSWGGPSQTLRPSGPGNPDYINVGGGDGFVCRIDPSDPDLVYYESQDGNLFRKNLKTGASKSIRPKAQTGAAKYRFNWNTPFILSNHNPHIYYSAGNYVFRSVKQGEDAKIISPEITLTKRGSATALAESPKSADVLWVGTDDGAVWLTRDGGKTWSNLSERFIQSGLPGPRWVSTIEASRHVAGRCYVAFDAHRSNDDEPYIFVTEDYGQTWRSLRANLPSGSSRVLREDVVNPDLLYLGTEFGAWGTLNRGSYWFKLNGTSLPTVAVHEFAQPTTAPDLVAGTHGRSIWVMDVTTLREMKPELAKDKTHLFGPSTVTRWRLDATREGMFRTGTRAFTGQNPPRGATIDYVLGGKAQQVELKVVDIAGKTVRELDVAKAKEPGMHRIAWDLTGGRLQGEGKGKGKFGGGKGFKGGGGGQGQGKGAATQAQPGGSAVPPGVYRVVLTVDGQEHSRTLRIDPDPTLPDGVIITDEAADWEWLHHRLKELGGNPHP
jgi:photosystem II stability/assembly factor-like uncharacterized protein